MTPIVLLWLVLASIGLLTSLGSLSLGFRNYRGVPKALRPVAQHLISQELLRAGVHLTNLLIGVVAVTVVDQDMLARLIQFMLVGVEVMTVWKSVDDLWAQLRYEGSLKENDE